ncbi:SsgA family sporulation/cell division regulator [Streptomyces sp. NPDC057682]|uniref:SsgA family sporulation/cell division regulator n=1 Tax=unclassified Streptomyces TaxID=2593676 RepID=UPI0036600972
MSPVIKEHARARLVTDARDLPVVHVELRHDAAADPGTILIAFPEGSVWPVGRELLEQGLRSPAERDGLRVWPCGRVQLVVERDTPEGVDVVQFDTAPLIRFLRRARTAAAEAERTAEQEAAPA